MAVSLTGTRVSAVALPWFVLVSTGSATRTGLVAFCEMAPYVVVQALSGPLVDKAGPRRVSWNADLLSAVAAAFVPALHVLGLLPFWLLLGLVAVIGVVRGPGDLAKTVMVPEAAERGGLPVERATGLAGVTERLASTVGPAVAGALVALVGPLAGLAVNAACFALGSLVVGVLMPRDVGRATETGDGTRQTREPAGYWRRLGEGFSFLRGDRLLLGITVTVGVTNLLNTAFSSVLLPVWAKESGGGPAVIGLTGSVAGVAAVCGSLIAAAVAHRLRRRLVFFAGFLLDGAPRFLILACGAPMWAVAAVFAVSGFGGGFLNPILGAVLYERVPRGLLGRVKALGSALAWAGIPFGGLLAGAAVTTAGLVPALVAGGAAHAVTISLSGLRPEWKAMDRSRRSRSTGGEEPPRESAEDEATGRQPEAPAVS
ncbi:MFS transporter [Streptomyces cinnamoneus]|uniref:MFS transporter n=2 Tax=Streptomyces cinnamoneus TaxID=53446 RepID=A0A2G1XLS5_STRCJ|nr:MFS transporter [Streptomyces cinnamoneus]PPT16842.1 MFS transporter [Streptomyces cinnamoneus]